MSAGLTAHPHNVLEAVEARAPGAVDRLAVVYSELYIKYVQLKLFLQYLRHEFSKIVWGFLLTFNADRHNKKRGLFSIVVSIKGEFFHVHHTLS